MVWVTNPLTFPIFIYAAHRIGTWLLGSPHHELQFEMTWRWLVSELAGAWEPLLLGCLVLGVFASALGYLTIRLAWRLHVLHAWRLRHRRRPETHLSAAPVAGRPRARARDRSSPRARGRG
jgi:uncharacterized protein (DUF2062 family)